MLKPIFHMLAWTLLLASCSTRKPVVVGSMNGTEQKLLGEIVAQHLEKRLEGVPVKRQSAGCVSGRSFST